MFFGAKGDQELTFQAFSEFVSAFRDEIGNVQFRMLSEGQETLSAKRFALSLLSFGEKSRCSSEISRIEQHLEQSPVRVSKQEFKDFLRVISHLDEIDFVLRSFVSAGEPFSQEQLKTVAQAVAKVQLTDDVLAIVFFVFDTNGDGRLDYSEFVGTLKGRQQFGFSKPKDNPIVRLGKCVLFCWDGEVSHRAAKSI